jgi:hypothetical protein
MTARTVEIVALELAYGSNAQTIADCLGYRQPALLIHQLAISGCRDLSTRLANAARQGSETL